MVLKTNQNNLYSAILFFIWPFLTVIIAMNNYQEKWTKNIVMLFISFFAYSRAMPTAGYSDVLSYKWKFEAMVEVDFSQMIGNLFIGGNPEFFTPFIQFLVSRFTTDYKIFFAVYGLIFGYFYTRNLWFLLGRVRTKMNYILILIFILIVMNTPFWNAAESRWMFALQVFLYGIIHYSFKNKITGMLILFSTMFVHLSYVVPIGVFALFLILGNRLNTYFVFFIISVFFSTLKGGDLRSQSSLLPTVYQERVEGYTNESYIENKKDSFKTANWYVGFYKKPLYYSIIGLTVMLFVFYRDLIFTDIYIYQFFNFSLLFSGVANMIAPFSSAGRFLILSAALVLLTTFLVAIQHKIIKVSSFLKLATPFLLIFIVVTLRIGFDSASILTLFGNPIMATLFDETTPVIEFIKAVLM